MIKIEKRLDKIKINIIKKKVFDQEIISFLNELSKIIIKSKESRKNNELMAFGFWCRNTNLQKFKQKYSKKFLENKMGIGLLFHIPPSNVISNFAYSLLFGLLSGNTNVVRIPKRSIEFANILISFINKKIKRKSNISKMINFINYKDEKTNINLSKICDGRLIWGSDETIKKFKNLITKKNCKNIYFSDKYSMSILNSSEIIKLNDSSLTVLCKNFYNDSYLMDQNACSSPHIIFWKGKKILLGQKIFWNKVYEIAKKNYKLDMFAAVDKYTNTLMVSSNKKIKINNYENVLITIQLNKLSENLDKFRGRWGLFYEYVIKNNLDLPYSKKYQTLSYYGFNKKELKNLENKSKNFSFNRVVPIGKSTEMNLFWDGYNLMSILSK
tara:strand:+ start:677 stop:1828 length:1152 start_codon:yes stop_codon:yes gene_type:complete